MYRIGIDTGGTNTDVVLTHVDTGRIYYTKTPTTPKALLKGINSGIHKMVTQCGISPQEIRELVYGTTIVVNMIAQKESEATALITTKGFRDVLEIGRAYRSENIYDINMEKPEPLVKRNLRFEVSERMNFMGEALTPVNEAEVMAIVDTLKGKNIRAIAVCLMHAYANPQHEVEIKRIIQREWPEVYVSVSSEIIPQFREYERTSTTVINAYMMPNMASHIVEFKEEMEKKQMAANCYMMQGNAGIMTFDAALQKPVSVSESGPIAGIIAANYMCELIGEKNIITLDMGGTSADVALIQNNIMRFTTENSVEGYPISIPTVDLSFIGAGGGSIAWCDEGGALKVGPISAGADPGPVCYGKGGTRPTVTDANLVTGRIRPEIFEENLENAMEKTAATIREHVAEPLAIDLVKAAEGIIDVVNSNMIRAIKFVSVQKGYDPRDFTLVDFVVSGGLHAGKLAEDLEIPKVIVPYSPGTFCALGLVLSDIKCDRVHTRLMTKEQISARLLNQIYTELDQQGLQELEKQQVNQEHILLVRTCDMRYFGQAFEISVPMPSKVLTEEDIDNLIHQFHTLHEQAYGHCMREDPIEFVNYRVSAIGTFSKPDLLQNARRIQSEAGDERLAGTAIFAGREYPVEVINRDALKAGEQVEGPAIIAEMGATTVVYPGHTAVIDEMKNIVMHTNLKGEEVK